MTSAGPASHPIRFCRTTDGVSIAYAVGGRGPAIVKTPNWLNHLELDVASPVWKRWIERMSAGHRLVRYDARGCGLSSRDRLPDDFEANRLDLEAVVAAAGLDRFALYGVSQGAAIAIDYAARHPERVTHLVLCGAYLRGALRRGAGPDAEAEALAMLRLVELGWGRSNPAFRALFATQFIPDATPAQREAFEELQRVTVTPQGAAALLASLYRLDVSAQAAAVRCPTLVLHATDDARVPFEEGRRVAAAIPGAEFVPLESRNHVLLDHEPAWARFFEALESFFARHGGADASGARAGFAELTDAERRVLDRIAAGWSNAQIAAGLGIQPKTVRNHINHVFAKLGVSDRARAIVLARDAGMGRG